MPRKREQEVFKFQELSEKAKEKARDHYRESMFDADSISEQFEQILSERGFDAPKVGWGLNYSQGDGVCFWGPIGLPTFFKWAIEGDDPKYTEEMKGKVKPFVSLQDVVGVRVLHETRNCHWNSMSVEVELTRGVIELIPDGKRQEVLDYLAARDQASWNYRRAMERAREERFKPVRDWEKRKEERDRSTRKGPKEWRPPVFIEKPEPLNIPDPIQEIPVVPHLEKVFDKAHREWEDLEARLPVFKEFMKEWVEDTSRELEKMGYDEIEYQESDEALEEFFEANEIEFEEDGTVVRTR